MVAPVRQNNAKSKRIRDADAVLAAQEADTPVVIAGEQSPWEQRTPASEDFVRSFIGSFSREPFQRQLAKFLQCGPTRHDIEVFAKRNPDKWAKSIQIFASLAGYTEKMEIDHNINIRDLSDTQVEQRLREIDALLDSNSAVIEHVPK